MNPRHQLCCASLHQVLGCQAAGLQRHMDINRLNAATLAATSDLSH